MASEFERSAQQEAVAAVERRWRLQHDAERRQRMRKQLGNMLAVVVLLVGLGGVGCFAIRYFEMDIPFAVDFDVRNLLTRLNEGRKVSAVEVERRDGYARLLASFKGTMCVLWRDAPKEIKPRTAVAGVRYLVLCGDKNDKCLYELFSDGRGSMSAMALSPLTAPIGVDIGEFRKAVTGRPFLLCVMMLSTLPGAKTKKPGKDICNRCYSRLRRATKGVTDTLKSRSGCWRSKTVAEEETVRGELPRPVALMV